MGTFFCAYIRVFSRTQAEKAGLRIDVQGDDRQRTRAHELKMEHRFRTRFPQLYLYNGETDGSTLRMHGIFSGAMQTRLLLGVAFFRLGHFFLEDLLLLLEVLHEIVNRP